MTDTDDVKNGEKKSHLSSFPISRLAPAFELVDLAREIARADDILSLQASGKLRLLADQIRGLQEEAREILLETRRNQELHRAECGFVKKAGHIYHLYSKPNDTMVFSMLSPEEWRGRAPHAYVGSYRLENDMSWTPFERGTAE